MSEWPGVYLDDDEKQAMNDLLGAYNKILRNWRLKHNQTELTAAVHVIQGFIVQHMLHRLSPDAWADWYDRDFFSDEVDGTVPDMVK
jgi:hypothetical protein